MTDLWSCEDAKQNKMVWRWVEETSKCFLAAMAFKSSYNNAKPLLVKWLFNQMITVITQIILCLTTGLIKVSIVCEMALDEKLSTKEHSDYLVY